MKEVGEALKLIFGKIGDFFDIFDLSFFVSGVVLVSAIYVWAMLAGFDLSKLLIGKTSIIIIIIGILACYVSGLVCFASGRWLRMWLIPKFSRVTNQELFDQQFLAILKGHGLDNEFPFSDYIKRKEYRGLWRLYVLLWADIRHTSSVEPSLQLLKRYWVMAATYDGVSVAIIVWGALSFSVAFGFGNVAQVPQVLLVALGVILLLLAASCLREAGRYVAYQVEEVVASIVSARNR